MAEINIHSLLLQLQKLVLPHRAIITRLLSIASWLLLLTWFGAYWLYSIGKTSDVSLLLDIGRKLGTLAFGSYVLTLLPGMIKRLKYAVLMPIMSILLPFRRQFGVLMFITAFVHQYFTTTLPYLVLIDFNFSKFTPQLLTHQIVGFLAWWLLLPLWLTSNDLAVKKLGKWWKRIHRLTYVAIFLIMAHVALVDHWLYAVILVGILMGNGWGLVREKKTASSTL